MRLSSTIWRVLASVFLASLMLFLCPQTGKADKVVSHSLTLTVPEDNLIYEGVTFDITAAWTGAIKGDHIEVEFRQHKGTNSFLLDSYSFTPPNQNGQVTLQYTAPEWGWYYSITVWFYEENNPIPIAVAQEYLYCNQ